MLAYLTFENISVVVAILGVAHAIYLYKINRDLKRNVRENLLNAIAIQVVAPMFATGLSEEVITEQAIGAMYDFAKEYKYELSHSDAQMVVGNAIEALL